MKEYMIVKVQFNVSSKTCTGGLKEIVCKVDFTAWNERRERAKRMNELQCMMNNRVRDLQETALFEMLASKDPELKAMLDEYKTLRGC